jgi:hypothetical protein
MRRIMDWQLSANSRCPPAFSKPPQSILTGRSLLVRAAPIEADDQGIAGRAKSVPAGST